MKESSVAYWRAAYCRSLCRHYAGRLTRQPKKPPVELVGTAAANTIISSLIESGEPFMVARFGGNEARACAEAHAIAHGVKRSYSRKIQRRMSVQAGFFPTDKESLDCFACVMNESSRSLDLLGWWGSCLQDYYLDVSLAEGTIRRDLSMCRLASLEPYYHPVSPWSFQLANKRVLVVSPFAETIQKAYANRSEIWKGTEILPEFELITMTSVQTAAGNYDSRFETWFAALEFMRREIDSLDYDVAIIGCGAYGFPLAAHVKESGRQAIHLGGGTQILFGVMGARWESNPIVTRYRNEFWMRPSAEETPKKAFLVEHGCYW